MIKRIFSTAVLMLMLVIAGAVYATAAAPDKHTIQPVTPIAPVVSAPVAKNKPVAAPEKQAAKTAAPEEDKYPAAYAKCTKTAEVDETKYDQIFEDCMDKNGFPREEFGTGGLPIDSGEDD